MKPTPLRMVRNHLRDIPMVPFPERTFCRRYQPGDEEEWIRIHAEADPINTATHALYRANFGADETVLAARQVFLCDRFKTPIGTATAWMDDQEGDPAWGRVHWVAILPAWQGKGLAKPLLALVLRRLRELGHERAYLWTDESRLPAVNLYLGFDFLPDIGSVEERTAWRRVTEALEER